MDERRLQRTAALTVVAAALMLPGCTNVRFVELREKPRNPFVERLMTAGRGPAEWTQRTDTFLRSTGYRGPDEPAPLLAHCRRFLDDPVRSRAALHSAAEVSYRTAEAGVSRDPILSLELFLDTARYGWAYLTLRDHAGLIPDPNNEAHRETTELYNAGVTGFLRLARQHQYDPIFRPMRLPLSGRQVCFELPFPTRLLSSEQIGEIEFTADYELRNLRNHHVTDGIGVPVIVRRRRSSDMEPLEQYYAPGATLPATLVMNFSRTDSAAPADMVRLQMYDPRDSDGISVSGNLLPLESDLSTPLARMLAEPSLGLLDTLGLVLPDRAKPLQGLYMLQPYDPDRIPVLMVHGLWSSPVTWMEMFNDLQADPEIRRRYQFWFYLYPSGEPLTFSAAALRSELAAARTACDPAGQSDALDRMVLVGHSMGGLISFLQSVDSEDRLWKKVSHLPVDQLHTDDQTRKRIRQIFFFNRNRGIDRVITIASPFGGSRYANSFTRWLSNSIIRLPGRTSELTKLIFEANHTGFWERLFTPQTSIDSLSKDSAVLSLMRELSLPEDVPHHNIVGVRSGRSHTNKTDGVVSFISAHRTDADSEIEVPAAHSQVHRHPGAISEVHRILHEHLRSARRDELHVRSATLSP